METSNEEIRVFGGARDARYGEEGLCKYACVEVFRYRQEVIIGCRTTRIGVRAKGRNDGQSVSKEGKRPIGWDDRQREAQT